jgi:hypothetical protein
MDLRRQTTQGGLRHADNFCGGALVPSGWAAPCPWATRAGWCSTATPTPEGSSSTSTPATWPGTQRVRPSTATRLLSIGIADGSRAPHSRVDATGTRRRLQALIAIGWPTEVLAAQLGRHRNSLCRSMAGQSVTAHTAHEVATLYERLWNSPPPRMTGEQCAASDAARAHAAAQGWLPPLAWDDIDTDPTPPALTASLSQCNDLDEIAVERALAGDRITYDDLTPVEQQEVVRRLTAKGTSIRDIAAQLGTTKRTVSRRRASFGAA